MNLSMECDIRVDMVEKEDSPRMPVRFRTLSRTCSLWALAEHDVSARKIWCRRHCHIIGKDPTWKFSVKNITPANRLDLFQFNLRELLL